MLNCRLNAITWGAVLWVGFAAAPAQQSRPSRPNIVFILADQYRFDCVAANGNPRIHTPHLDRLAGQGVSFQRAYAAQPVCSPNRAAILTGLYPHAAGVTENNVSLPKSSRTLAEILAPTGYACGYFGKWHLGRRDAFTTMPDYPGDARGDNHYFGKGPSRRYGVDVIVEDAIHFIREHRDGPFYLYVSLYPPHPPYSVPNEYEERYKEIADRQQRTYYAMCTKVDEKVGDLLAAIDELRIADQTLVVFTADHGHNFERRWNNHDKRLCYDAAARLPLLMRWPGVLPEKGRPEGLISSVDLAPTILSMVGEAVPTDMQGLDMSRLARGTDRHGRRFAFIENLPFPFAREKGEERCVLDENWKLILSTHRDPELCEYREDPGETRNRWDQMRNTETVAGLKKALANWALETRDELAPKLLERVP